MKSWGVSNWLMVAVDPRDDSIERHVVRHYAYDPERRERRHQVVAAFSTGKEAAELMRELSDDWMRRRDSVETADPHEYFSSVVWQPGYNRLQNNARLLTSALRRGVSVERVQDLELPPNVSFLRSGARTRPLRRRLVGRFLFRRRARP